MKSRNYWLSRAEEQRTVADGMRDHRCRTTMLSLAAMSEQLAAREDHVDLPHLSSAIERLLQDLYNTGLYWIIREVPINTSEHYSTTELMAKLFGRGSNEVAADLRMRMEPITGLSSPNGSVTHERNSSNARTSRNSANAEEQRRPEVSAAPPE